MRSKQAERAVRLYTEYLCTGRQYDTSSLETFRLENNISYKTLLRDLQSLERIPYFQVYSQLREGRLTWKSYRRLVPDIQQKETKFCKKCRKTLSTKDFCKDNVSFDGLQHWCRKCQNTSHRKWYWKSKKNRDRILARTRRRWRLRRTQEKGVPSLDV